MVQEVQVSRCVLDGRPEDRASSADYLPGSDGTTCAHTFTSDDGWLLQVWRFGPVAKPARIDWAVVITPPHGSPVGVYQMTARGSQLKGGGRAGGAFPWLAVLAHPPAEPFNEAMVAGQVHRAWLAARSLHHALSDVPQWWDGAPPDQRGPGFEGWLTAWATAGTRSWRDAQAWQRLGIWADTVPDWADHGIIPADAAVWIALRPDGKVSGPEAGQWVEHGFTPVTARPWFPARPANEWADPRHHPRNAALFVAAGWTPDQATALNTALRTAGVDVRQRNQTVGKWVRSGFSPERAAAYAATGMGVREAKREELLGPPSSEALALIAALR